MAESKDLYIFASQLQKRTITLYPSRTARRPSRARTRWKK